MKRIAILTSYWSTNIGNSFFQLGAEYVLKRIFPNDLVFPIGDQPGYAFPQHGWPKNAFDVTATLDIDLLVVLGPVLRPEFEHMLLPTLKALAQKGTKFLFMGMGMMQYDDATIERVKGYLRELPVAAFVSRDRPTYDAFHEVCPHAFDGVDVAFFVSDVWGDAPRPNMAPYMVMNFDQLPEPDFVESPSGIPIGKATYEMRMPDFRRKFSEKGTLFNIVERMVFPQKATTELGGLQIVRTDHRYNPVVLKKIYNAPNTYSGDTPYSYFALYSGCELTLSNRVHACAATLAFGNKAMLVSKTPRAYLLDRAGAATIKEKPTSLDMDKLAAEKRSLIEFVGNALVAL